jgi:hypothetical protein
MKRLAILGIAFYLLALVLLFPAPLALRWFAPDALRMQSPSGSVWRGSAQAASFASYYLGTTQWALRPLDLARGLIAYHVDAQGPDGFIDGVFGATFGGDVRIRELSGTASLASLRDVLPPELPTSLFRGRVQLKVDELRLDDGWPTQGRGRVEVVDLALLSPPEQLGGYVLEMEPADGEGLRARFQASAAAPLEIEGTVTLNPDRTYDLQCTARARPNASPNVQASVPLICPPQG